MSEAKLRQEIITRSSSKLWEHAKLEWLLHEIYESKTPDTCLCGKFPIIEICILQNKINRNQAIVGNCCVKKFIGLPSDKIFQAIKRVRKDSTKSLNIQALIHGLQKGWINKWEYNFYVDVQRKKNLTANQAAKKTEINAKFNQRMQR